MRSENESPRAALQRDHRNTLCGSGGEFYIAQLINLGSGFQPVFPALVGSLNSICENNPNIEFPWKKLIVKLSFTWKDIGSLVALPSQTSL